MASYTHSDHRKLFTMRDAIFHCIHTRLNHLEEKPDPQAHTVDTPYGPLVCVLRAPAVALSRYKVVVPLVWSAIPPRKAADGDIVLYLNEAGTLVPRTLSEMEFHRLLPYHLEVLFTIALGQDQRLFVKVLSGDQQAYANEYDRLEKLYSPTGMYKHLIAVPELV